MKSFLTSMAITLLAGLVILSNLHHPQLVLADQSPDSIRELEAEFLQSSLAHGSQGYTAYYADDAVELPNGQPLITGKGNIAKTMSFLDNKQNRLTWTPVAADISDTLGYSYGNYEFKSVGKDGRPTTDHGKYTSIWKKQPDGQWKVVLDMGNSNSRSE